MPEQTSQRRFGGFVVSLVEQSVGSLAPPGMRTFQAADESFGREVTQPGLGRPLESSWNDPINPAPVPAPSQIQVRHDIHRDMHRLQHFPSQVQHVQRAVRGVHEIYRAKPVIRRCQELGRRFVSSGETRFPDPTARSERALRQESGFGGAPGYFARRRKRCSRKIVQEKPRLDKPWCLRHRPTRDAKRRCHWESLFEPGAGGWSGSRAMFQSDWFEKPERPPAGALACCRTRKEKDFVPGTVGAEQPDKPPYPECTGTGFPNRRTCSRIVCRR